MSVTIRPYEKSDTGALINLFREAVHSINSKDYTQKQIAVWAPENIDEKKWAENFSRNITFIAEFQGIIVGFADMTHSEHLEHMYVGKVYQGRFIALKLFKTLEKRAKSLKLSKITTDCSITAKIPAERVGFKVVKKQIVVRSGISLINYLMQKII